MRILGIETSCDETAAAIVADGRTVLSNIVASQDELHIPYGGVVPEIASRAHLRAILPVIDEAFKQADLTPGDIDAVAVAHHPGLIGALLIGLTTAKTLAWLHEKPLIGVNHLYAHAYAAQLGREESIFPAIGLVASGGHTMILHSRSPRDHERLGATIDDAAGETFDKVAKILGLPYPGGPNVDRVAKGGDLNSARFPRSMLAKDSLDFSFSGLKTAVLYHVHGRDMSKARRELSDQETSDVAAAFQEAVVDVLCAKVMDAARRTGVKRIICGGGVTANTRLRERLGRVASAGGMELIAPPIRLCVDNAAMVAGLAWHKYQAGEVDDLGLDALPTSRATSRRAGRGGR
jgi:tRNA N6-adenosine threonylcarbamoyltransferase